MRHRPVAVDELDDRAREERAENRLEFEPLGGKKIVETLVSRSRTRRALKLGVGGCAEPRKP
jgi:hypothetical protein